MEYELASFASWLANQFVLGCTESLEIDMVAFYAGLGLVMITGIMAIVEMSMGFVMQQNRWEPDRIYSKSSSSALDRDWLQVLDIINNVNVNGKDLALWSYNGTSLRSCTCYLVERSVFGKSENKLREDECLLGQDGGSNAIFPSDLIPKNSRPIQSVFARGYSPATSFVTSCDFKRSISLSGTDVKLQHRVLVFPDSSSKTLKLYSCAFDDISPDNICSFEKS